ncbi:putative ABC transporter permease/ATP-binding protein [Oscillibacter valericigenes Sjm18-20]|nr:putative ABC transporter permease/ATP-binding protein [Oscillibacter valericigenes Sjm18-20]
MIRGILALLTSKGKRALASSVLWFSIYALSGIAMMLLVLKMLDLIMTEQDISLYVYWRALVLLLLLRGISSTIGDLRKHFAGFDLNYELREKIINRLKSFSLGFYTNERLGEISTVIHRDVDNMVMVVGHLCPRMLSDFIVSAVIITALLIVNVKMGLLMILILPAALLILILGNKRGTKLEAENGNRLADMISLFVEYVKGIPLLKAFSISKKIDEKLEKATVNFGESSKELSRYKARQLSRYGFFVDLSYGVMAITGAVFVFSGKLALMTYFLYIIVSKEVYKPFNAMETYWMNYLSVTDSYCRIKKILDAPIIEEPDKPLQPSGSDIEFRNVGFSYEKDEFAMRNVSFKAPANTLTALVGESGSGKTTVTNLLLRFWDIENGSIQIGGTDIRSMSYDDLLDSVSIVMQNVQLFADTIEGNIRLGNADATDEEIIRAAQKARIHDFIMTLPQGYKTVIGENGATLSGGQRQRISIARAFLKDAPILVLDEFTSSIDPGNEVLIQEAITDLIKNRTVLVIAHHLNTIRSADQILVFRKGEIVERGSHKELLKREGYYKKLFKAQTILHE